MDKNKLSKIIMDAWVAGWYDGSDGKNDSGKISYTDKIVSGKIDMEYNCPKHGNISFLRFEKGRILCGDCYCDGKEVEVKRSD